ncbi:MAG TPA: hypothetical protein PLZ42_03715 [Methanothrix sp.]|nr:hypothetical protein [Methanothrix sp.]
MNLYAWSKPPGLSGSVLQDSMEKADGEVSMRKAPTEKADGEGRMQKAARHRLTVNGVMVAFAGRSLFGEDLENDCSWQLLRSRPPPRRS